MDYTTTPGKDTTEYKVIKWAAVVAGIIVSIVTGLTAAGVLPATGGLATVIGAVLGVAHVISGYAKSRGVVKSAELYAKSEASKTNPQ